MHFKAKIALITGASRGIGKAIAIALARYGIKIIGTATKENGVDKINSYLREYGIGKKLDYFDQNSVEELLNFLKRNKISIDILINNAGIISDALFIKMKEENWKSVININLVSIIYLSKIILKNMIKNHYGKIINISSVVGTCGNIGQTNYSASKAGLIGFSKSLALEVASKGINVNVVSPGFIDTDMTNNINNKNYEKIISKIPMNRLGTPEEVASIVAFLASEEASYITGETINVNGGIYMK